MRIGLNLLIMKFVYNTNRHARLIDKTREKLNDYLNHPRFVKTRHIYDAIFQFITAIIKALLMSYLMTTIWMNGSWETEEVATKVILKYWPQYKQTREKYLLQE